MDIQHKFIDAGELHRLLASSQEFALLDVREQMEFSREHILLASCAPLSHLESRGPALAPCHATEIIIMDAGNSPNLKRSERAWHILNKMGYSNVKILAGGLEAWKNAGYVTVNGIGSLSKGFGEYIEAVQKTPSLSPEEVMEILKNPDEKSIVIDVRPVPEYNNMNIPGSINLPGCEIAYRIAQVPISPDTTIIVNCAGRTRSIIGTQTLINYGVPNKIFALRGGTMNWQLAGFKLHYGTKRDLPALALEKFPETKEHIERMSAKYAVKYVDIETYYSWEKERDRKTLYVFDVRQPEEYAAGHLPGSLSAQGGQLVQATDEYAAVRNGRFVLVDDDELRAVVTAHWLGQMGLPNVYVLKGGLKGLPLQKGMECPAKEDPQYPGIESISPLDAQKIIASGEDSICLDIASSKGHREGHISGSKWVIRAYLPRAKEYFPRLNNVIVTSDTSRHAALGAMDAKKLWPQANVYFVDGGTRGWEKAGLPMEKGMQCPLCAEDDVWYRPYTDINASPEAMKEYFNWESELVARIEEDNCVKFHVIKN